MILRKCQEPPSDTTSQVTMSTSAQSSPTRRSDSTPVPPPPSPSPQSLTFSAPTSPMRLPLSQTPQPPSFSLLLPPLSLNPTPHPQPSLPLNKTLVLYHHNPSPTLLHYNLHPARPYIQDMLLPYKTMLLL
ncbi:hypothetical protein Pcinc_043496 [Petrolisthes cinctipes]|uniref:Uncharacterized protein n=1 Tax=Petrolisthes cinctipes TaxID=88211 RepID=A0AAE1EHU1_PETCI|nr:hypothetical protein Pcinc_043496 [Petrolisthes cinctipes]